MARFLEYIPGTSFLHRMNRARETHLRPAHLDACFARRTSSSLACILMLDFALAATCKMTRQAAGLAAAIFHSSSRSSRCSPPRRHASRALAQGYIGTGSLLAALIIIMRLIACASALLGALYHEAGRHR